jgi:hypothetical protein
MSTTVHIWFDFIASDEIAEFANFFTLDDPVKGQLDGPYGLAGPVGVDVTDDVRRVSTRRGRRSESDEIDAGACTVTLLNDERTYDPDNADSPYAGLVKPWKRVDVARDGEAIFTGVIEDWSFAYALDEPSWATVDGTDALAPLAARELDAHTATPETSGARVDAVLDRAEVGFVGTRDIDAGVATLQGDDVAAGDNALGYLQLVTRTEQGYLYVTRDGTLRFRSRQTTFEDAGVVFTDDGSGIGYTRIATTFGSEQLHNRVVVERLNGSTVTADDLGSQAEYGIRTLSLDGLLYDSDAQAQALADYLVARFSQPRYRITQITVDLDDEHLDDVDRVAVLGLDIADLVSVVFTPSGVGDPIERTVRIEGIVHDIDVDAIHTVTFDLREVDLFFILDHAEFGQLDVGKLGF